MSAAPHPLARFEQSTIPLQGTKMWTLTLTPRHVPHGFARCLKVPIACLDECSMAEESELLRLDWQDGCNN